MCVYSQAQRSNAIHPPCTARWNPPRRPPIDRVQVEKPRSPSGASPVFRPSAYARSTVPCHGPADGRGVLRPRPHAARRRIRRGVLGGDAGRPGSRRGASRASACCTALFNRIGETLPVDGDHPPGGDAGQGPVARAALVAAGEAAADGLAAMVQPFAGALFEMHRAAGRPVVLATTTPYDLVQAARRPPRPRRRGRPRGTGSTPTARTTARSSVRSSGRAASSRPCARGPPSTASTSAPATPTPTASTTPRCCRPSARRSSSTPTRGWCCWRRRVAGRSSTSTSRPGWSRSRCSASSCSASPCSSARARR